MREINLNGKQYKISGEITKRAVSPWMAKVSSGSREYSDFSQAQLQEYSDFRNGIGQETESPSESNRTWFTEGIDFTTPRKAVLGPKITTAGSVGSAPVKIIDFQDNTYVTCEDGSIKCWNAEGLVWDDAGITIEDCEDDWDLYQNPNAAHTTSSDYKVGSKSVIITVNSSIENEVLALETIDSDDLTGYDQAGCWIKSKLAKDASDLQLHLASGVAWTSPDGGSGTNWTAPSSAYDDSTGTTAYYAAIPTEDWSNYLELTHAAVYGTQLQYYVDGVTQPEVTLIDVDVWHDGTWHDVYEGSFTEDEWITKALPDGSVHKAITKVQIRFWNNDSSDTKRADLAEFDFESSSLETIDVPALAADTWTRIAEDISTPSNLGTVTRVGIKAVTEVVSGDIFHIDDLRAIDTVITDDTPLDAIVITDNNDEYLIVSTAADAHYWTGGATDEWSPLISWHEGHSVVDEDTYWSNGTNLIDNDTNSSASKVNIGITWSSYIEVVEDPFVRIDRIRYFVHSSTGSDVTLIDVDIYHDNAWEDVYNGSFTENQWEIKIFTDMLAHNVEKIRARFYADNANNDDAYISGLQFGSGPSEYMANYGSRLYWIASDGSSLSFSAIGDVTTESDHWKISGDLGHIYDLFEGKLLADGTPTLYACGNKGVYSFDLTNEIAYRQEVGYPPLTYAGHDGKYWNGSLFIAAGYGILKITPSLATFLGPDQDDGLPAGYHGIVYDGEPVASWLVYCVNGGTTDKSSIIKRNSSYGGNLQVYTTSDSNKPIACIHHSPSTMYDNGRLWFGEGTDVKYMMFPDTTSNVKQVSTYEYVDDSGYGKLPIFRKLAAITKVALGVAAITKSCDSDEYIQVFYGLNGATPTTSLGTFKTSPRPEILTFNRGLGTEFYTVQFAIKLFRATANTTNSPELESLLFYYMPRPETINAWTFNVLATDENAEALITAFEAIRDTKVLVPFYPTGDTKKTSYKVALTTMPLRFAVENQQTRRGVIQVTLEQVFNG